LPVFGAYYPENVPESSNKRLIEEGQIGKQIGPDPDINYLSEDEKQEVTWRVIPEIQSRHFLIRLHQLDYLDFLFGPVQKPAPWH
jgi:hypothetical protein